MSNRVFRHIHSSVHSHVCIILMCAERRRQSTKHTHSHTHGSKRMRDAVVLTQIAYAPRVTCARTAARSYDVWFMLVEFVVFGVCVVECVRALLRRPIISLNPICVHCATRPSRRRRRRRSGRACKSATVHTRRRRCRICMPRFNLNPKPPQPQSPTTTTTMLLLLLLCTAVRQRDFIYI